MLKKVYREFFCISKDEKISDRVFKARIGLSVLTMLVCCVVFCSATFAWFDGQQSSSITSIQSADYGISVYCSDIPVNGSYICPLATEDTHTFMLEAYGSASIGYCEITISESDTSNTSKVYATTSIKSGEKLEISIVAKKETKISFVAHWGTPAQVFADRLENNEKLECSKTPYVSYTVVENVTLEMIADHYGVDPNDILLYNGITADELTVGTTIKIPNPTKDEPLVIPDPVDPSESEDPSESSEPDESEEPSEPGEPSEPDKSDDQKASGC